MTDSNTTNPTARTGLVVSGRPMSTPLRDVRSVSRQLVGHFVNTVIPCGTLPGDVVGGDVTAVTEVCLELAVDMLDGKDLPAKTDRLAATAAGWAREGIPIDTILHAVHEGFTVGLRRIMSPATARDFDQLVDGAGLVIRMLDLITTTVARAYVREHKALASEHHSAVHTLTSALLGGNASSTMARECGVEIAAEYCVVALDIPAHPDERRPGVDPKIVARRKLRRVQAELAARCGGVALALLSVDGGTVLVPSDSPAGGQLDGLIEGLSAAAQVRITAAVATAEPWDIPAAADRAHEVLDMAQRLECEPGLYRFTDMALEYQLTRPGPGRDTLGSVLDPLDAHPELLETLRCHISHNLNRQRTAHVLHIHTNTVDYRLKRIGQLTGFDPSRTTGLWQLRSGLIARSFARNSGPNRP
ncbi:PucR family transcriptional regulator [Nocardia stercoris]|uniref:PucR family transcriptional regulator n=1 Tax=Nocardia stercoris TaxID=2483361 RepID=A0A3M2L0P6_9NOCA|nr:helix-turn-helix domain-containing protein [Nocardia stercoris]RMI30063.1 PucR family transcriptional regulator [Nocardia stercoris]